MNKYILEKGYSAEKQINEGLVLTACIFNVCMVVPYINILLLIPNLILHYVMLNNLKNGLIYLIDYKSEAVGEAASQW